MQVRHDYWLEISEGWRDTANKNLSEDQKQIKRTHYWPNPPISENICNTIIWNTVLHCMGHSGVLTLTLLLALVNKGTDTYRKFMDCLSKQHNYLKSGDIITSTTEFLRMLQELSFLSVDSKSSVHQCNFVDWLPVFLP